MSLIEKIVYSENIKMAIDNIRKNKGSQTLGTDGKTIEYIIANKEVIIEKIRSSIQIPLVFDQNGVLKMS